MSDSMAWNSRALSAADVAGAAQLACLLEVSARKPGNVSPGRPFSDLGYDDFLAGAAAIGGPLSGAATRSLGSTIRMAVEASALRTRSNTNLGIVLLLVPLAGAALTTGWDRSPASLRASLRSLLEASTVEDARNVYEAIRLAAPGGLGEAPSQDVAHEPDVTLLDAMRLAAERDRVAREYATGFEGIFETGVPALVAARRDGLAWGDAVVETFLTLLAESPDTHIARRRGVRPAEEVSERARRVLEAGGVRSRSGRQEIEAMDLALRDSANSRNPGTTADLTAAAIFVILLTDEGWFARAVSASDDLLGQQIQHE